MKSVVMLPAGIDACALYRLLIPHLHIPNSKFIFNPEFKLPIEELVGNDVAVVQRLASVGNYEAVIRMKRAGLKVVYDIDDNLHAIPSYNPGKKHFNLIKENFPIIAKACDAITVSTRPLKAAVTKHFKIPERWKL